MGAQPEMAQPTQRIGPTQVARQQVAEVARLERQQPRRLASRDRCGARYVQQQGNLTKCLARPEPRQTLAVAFDLDAAGADDVKKLFRVFELRSLADDRFAGRDL